MKRKPFTITDIAEKLQVSRASVSRALSGAPGVGEELREKIIRYAEEIEYQPKAAAGSVNTKCVNAIGLILGDVRNPFYASLVFSIQKILCEHNYFVTIYNSEYDADRELEFIQMTEKCNFAGLILITAQSPELGKKLCELTMPKVLVNRILPSYEGDSVLTDNYQAGYEATLHLINLGHRKIGFIQGHQASSAASHRFEGYLQALQNYSIPYYEEFIWNSDLRLETGYTIAEEFVKLKEKPSAVISVNDMTSLGFIDGCEKHGIRIPEDLSVISFDDIPIADLKDIQLTTVSQHAEKMGSEAARLLLKQLKNPQAQPERIILTPSVMVRKTTGAPAF